jgi:hypothetical protein
VTVDCFGSTRDPATKEWLPQPAYDPVTNPTTGMWHNWYGDAEGIVRETTVRALELSLGLDHGEDPDPAGPRRHWPIEVFLKCAQAFYEGWVTWRRHGDGPREGQVTVIHTTPGMGSGILDSPKRPPELQRRGYEFEPTAADDVQGMWVVRQARQVTRVADTTAGSPLGMWTMPTPGAAVRSEGPVVCASPSEADGGVRPGGRAFTEPRPLVPSS